jgi:hypothetical protein
MKPTIRIERTNKTPIPRRKSNIISMSSYSYKKILIRSFILPSHPLDSRLSKRAPE